jgi:hypothetical protein
MKWHLVCEQTLPQATLSAQIFFWQWRPVSEEPLLRAHLHKLHELSKPGPVPELSAWLAPAPCQP